MSKLVAFVLLVVVLAGVGYIYVNNADNVGNQIDTLKLKYSIEGSNGSKNIILFTEELEKIRTTSRDAEELLDFETSFWKSMGYNNKVNKFLISRKGLFTVDCASEEYLEMKRDSDMSIDYINDAYSQFDIVRADMSEIQVKNYLHKLESLELSIETNNNQLTLMCLGR